MHVTRAAKRLDLTGRHLTSLTIARRPPTINHTTQLQPLPSLPIAFLLYLVLAFTQSATCRTKLTSMTSATAHLGDDLALRDAHDARTLPGAALAAGIATNTVAQNAAQGPPTVVRKVQEATSLTAQVEELQRARSKARTT